MPQIVISIAAAAAFLATAVYLHALYRLHDVIASERPDWVNRRGSLSFFYSAFPPVFDPHIGLAVIRRAFSRSLGDLKSPLAAVYARRVRWCLVLLLAGYGILIINGAVSGP